MLKEYYRLAKPGIVYGNLLTTVAAYLYACRWDIAPTVFLAMIFGLGLVIGSACVFNNFLDRDIDLKMKRTKSRAIATGVISTERGLVYGTLLGLAGFALLLLFVSVLSSFIALVGFVVYVFAYTLLKRTTPWATEVGSISGAVPIVVGYTAVTNQFDATALMLFVILMLWQMPHFYAIAMSHADEYAAAGIPVLPLKKGTRETKRRMLLFIVLFAIAVFALTLFGYAGYSYLVVVEVAALVWFWRGTRGIVEDESWPRKLFFMSLIVLVVFSVMLSLAQLLP